MARLTGVTRSMTTCGLVVLSTNKGQEKLRNPISISSQIQLINKNNCWFWKKNIRFAKTVWSFCLQIFLGGPLKKVSKKRWRFFFHRSSEQVQLTSNPTESVAGGKRQDSSLGTARLLGFLWAHSTQPIPTLFAKNKASNNLVISFPLHLQATNPAATKDCLSTSEKLKFEFSGLNYHDE